MWFKRLPQTYNHYSNEANGTASFLDFCKQFDEDMKDKTILF